MSGRWCHTRKEARLLEEAGLLVVDRFLPLALEFLVSEKAFTFAGSHAFQSA